MKRDEKAKLNMREDEVTFKAYAHVVCQACGWGMKADLTGFGVSNVVFGCPTKCVNPKCRKWRGKIIPG